MSQGRDGEQGRLVLVGLGLEEQGISVAGRRAARQADAVFLEAYTAKAPQSRASLEAMVEGEVQALDRASVEDGTKILEAARQGLCVLLVAGDPLSATTHVSVRLKALEEGLSVGVHYAGSILTAAAGALGLSHYKFGRTTTLVTPSESYFPDSPYDVVQENLERGLHTLVLLDVREDGSFMSAAQGAEVMARLEDKRGEGTLAPDRQVLALARVGADDEQAWRGSIEQIQALDAGEPMHSIVVPGQLGTVEQEALAVCSRQA